MIRFNKDEYLDNLFLILKKRCKSTGFGYYDRVYFKTNENTFMYNFDNFKNKRILTVTSSGDHILHTILNGADDITAFDINKITKIYSNLKISMIKEYDYKEYIENMIMIYYFFNANIKDKKYVYNILNKISNYLSEDEVLFWIDLYNNKSDFKLFREFDGNFANTAYNCKENYNIIKDKINNVNIKYIDNDILEIIEKNQQYDSIIISNILDYIDFNEKSNLLNNLCGNLNDNGQIYFSCFYNYLLGINLNFKLDDRYKLEQNKEDKQYFILKK